MGWFSKSDDNHGESVYHYDQDKQDDMATAEAYIREGCDKKHISALVRHYHVSETNEHIERFSGARITDRQAADLVQKIRDEYGLGPIKDYNMPGYVDPSDDAEDQEDQRSYNAYRDARDTDVEHEQSGGGGLLGWLFGR